VDVGYRWYDAKNIAPLFPFGFGLSYTSFAFSGLTVGALSGGNASVGVTVKNTGSRAGTDVAQLYVGDPASTGEPPHQLKGFQRVTLNAGQSQTLNFTVSQHDLAYWNNSTSQWTTPAGSYQVLLGDSSRNLPVSGAVSVPTTITGDAITTQGTVTVSNPHGMSSPVGRQVNWAFAQPGSGLSYTASGLPPGLAMNAAGLVTGTASGADTYTVTVTGRNASGASGSVTFVWTTT
jgi:beta-glucosidase